MRRFYMTPLMRICISFDLLVTLCLAVPGASTLFIDTVSALGVMSGLSAPLPPFGAFEMFMVNLAGVLGVCWNGVYLRTASFTMARVNAVARLAVSALILYYVLALGVTPVLLLFLVSEVFGSVLEFRLQPQ